MIHLLSPIIFFAFFNAPQTVSWDEAKLHTAKNETYLSQIEKEVIYELNKVRTDPTRYAEEYLTPMTAYYEGKLLKRPQETPLVTQEGVSALYETIEVLKKTPASSALKPSKALYRAAASHVAYQMKSGSASHYGKKDDPQIRIEKFGEWDGNIGENLSFGPATARDIVISLLIDDGVPDRGHRHTILNADFHYIGTATGPHPKWGYQCVQNFATTIKEK